MCAPVHIAKTVIHLYYCLHHLEIMPDINVKIDAWKTPQNFSFLQILGITHISAGFCVSDSSNQVAVPGFLDRGVTSGCGPGFLDRGVKFTTGIGFAYFTTSFR